MSFSQTEQNILENNRRFVRRIGQGLVDEEELLYGWALPETLEGERPVRRILLADIIASVSWAFGISAAHIKSHRRPLALARCRQAYYLLADEFTQQSLTQIGLVLGGRDHSSVVCGINKAVALSSADSEFSHKIELARDRLRESRRSRHEE